MDDEILEIGEDGGFEIVSTKSVKQVEVAQPDYTSHKVTLDDEDELSAKQELLDSLNAGEYKVYKAEGFLYAIVKLQDGENVERVGTIAQEVFIKTDTTKKYVVPLENSISIDAKSGKCTTWKGYVTVRYTIM